MNTVINYDAPKDYVEYIHRIGRCGRMGNKGRSITILHPNVSPQLVREIADGLQKVLLNFGLHFSYLILIFLNLNIVAQ